MNILISNDDGINASGIRHLIDDLREVEGVKLYVCAPDRQRSAASHSISTATGPLILKEVDVPGVEWAQTLSGTPADCVKSAMKRLRAEKGIEIDAVFSGINHGSNLGTDVHYSGTVGAAIEGTFEGVPAVAVSVGTHHPTEEQLANCRALVQDICRRILPTLDKRTVLNINFPNIPPSEIKGLKVCRLGPRDYNENFEVLTNPRGEQYFWYTGKLVHYEGLPEDLDVTADENGYITVTPLMTDMTDYDMIGRAESWELTY